MTKGVVKRRLSSGSQAFGFVILVLGAWWLFASLANSVVSCVPWQQCRATTELADSVETALLVVTLFASLWVAHRLFYSSNDFDEGEVRVTSRETGVAPRLAAAETHQKQPHVLVRSGT